MLKRGFRILIIALAGIAVTSAEAAADEPPAAQPSPEAAALFQEAMTLMEQGKFEQACPKLEECLRIAGGLGVRFNLADCHSHIGRTASAWRGFQEVAAMAGAAGQTERADVARQRAAAIEPLLSKVVLLIDRNAQPSGLSVLLDNAPIAPAVWGIPVPVDPGAHQIEAAAPGYQTWRAAIQIEAKPGTTPISPPPLVREMAAPQAPPAPAAPRATAPNVAPPPSGWTTGRIAAVAVGGVGIAGLALGAGFAVDAAAKRDSSFEQCLPKEPNRCSTTGVKLRNEAFTAAHISTAAFVVGGAALAGGAVLFFTGSPEPTAGAKSALRLEAHPGGAGITLAGRW